jgi:O-antigen ligase
MWEALIWLVPVAVLAAGLRRPDGGLLVLAATLPLFGSPPGGPYLAALDAAALAAVATAWRAGPAPRSAFDRPAQAFVVIGCISALPFLYEPPGWHPSTLAGTLLALLDVQAWAPLFTWRALANLLLGWLLFVAVRRAFAGRSIRPLAQAFAVGLLPLLVLGLAEHFGAIDLDSYRAVGASIGRVVYAERLHSLFFHSGWLGEYLLLTVPFAVAGLLAGEEGRPAGRARSICGWSLLAFYLVALPFIAQRATWIAAATQLVALVVLVGPSLVRDRRLLRRVILAAGLAATLVAGALAWRADMRELLGHRLERTMKLAGRRHLWEASVQMASERPAMGWGIGAFAPVFRALKMEEIAGPYDWLTAHSHYLMLLVERGVVGLAAWLLIAWALLVVLKALLRQPDPEARLWGRVLVVIAVGVGVHGLVQYLFFLKAVEWAFWLLLGAAAVVAGRGVEVTDKWTDRSAWALVVVALLILPWRVFGADEVDPPGNRSYGFHHTEGYGDEAFAWTHGRAAKRVSWAGEELVLEMANGHPRPGEHPVEVVVRIDGGEVARRTLVGGWEEIRVPTGPARAESMVVGIEARPTFRPFAELRRYPGLEPSLDIRSLGVAVRPFRWR